MAMVWSSEVQNEEERGSKNSNPMEMFKFNYRSVNTRDIAGNCVVEYCDFGVYL